MMNVFATSIVLLLAGGLVAAMVFMIRLSTDDSDKHPEIKQFVTALFGGAASPVQADPAASGQQESAAARDALSEEPFTEPCPACGDPVTHQHVECPSCGLRLI
ncbi:hypothetical protein [Paenibacillus sp. CF384]|uniref:hypothetical protein n=1 Tax=Paenibacillus sp. CF384 TaxID=1884382 RepID=UPI00089AD3A3|nr:hypothetical protein [Paenibacillus sp. CF384]SDW67816.1 hypothetical protein SAMN05518855_1004108 [Paenibacillus sp. CF384]